MRLIYLLCFLFCINSFSQEDIVAKEYFKNGEFEKAKLSDYKEIHIVMETSAREISRKSYHKEVVDTFDKFYVEKTTDYIKQTIENSNNHTILAKSGKRIIGFIQLKVNKQTGTISHLYILPGYEGNSVGTQLFSIIKKKAIEMKIEKLFVESTLNAVTYYEKLGFVNTGRIPDNSAYNLEMKLNSV